MAVAESFLATGCREGLAGARHQVQVIVQVGEVGAACGCDAHQAHVDGGPAISQATARRLTCDASVVDGHHVIHWADGGETKLDNLVLLGRRHHRLVHEGGFTVASDGAGGWHFARPDGTTLPRFFAAQPVVRGELVASRGAWISRLCHSAPAGAVRGWTTIWLSALSRPSRGGGG